MGSLTTEVLKNDVRIQTLNTTFLFHRISSNFVERCLKLDIFYYYYLRLQVEGKALCLYGMLDYVVNGQEIE